MRPRQNRLTCIAVLSGLLLAGPAACGGDDDTSAPVPQPVPDLIRLSSPLSTKSQTLVVGLPGAASSGLTVVVRDRITGKTATSQVTVTGTFSVVLEVGQGAMLEAMQRRGGSLSDPVVLSVRSPSYGLSLGQPKAGVVSAPDALGRVTVSNDGGAGKPLLMDATPAMQIIVSNAATAEVVFSQTDKDGRFSVVLGGAKGQTMQLLLVDPMNKSSTSDFVSIQVP